jgi:hypothetical protein
LTGSPDTLGVNEHKNPFENMKRGKDLLPFTICTSKTGIYNILLFIALSKKIENVISFIFFFRKSHMTNLLT